MSLIESAPSRGSSLAVAVGFFETLGFESESQLMKLGTMCLGHLVSQPTLGPLGQPEKAIGHESPIEPWLAPDHRSALRVSELIGFVAIGDENRW